MSWRELGSHSQTDSDRSAIDLFQAFLSSRIISGYCSVLALLVLNFLFAFNSIQLFLSWLYRDYDSLLPLDRSVAGEIQSAVDQSNVVEKEWDPTYKARQNSTSASVKLPPMNEMRGNCKYIDITKPKDGPRKVPRQLVICKLKIQHGKRTPSGTASEDPDETFEPRVVELAGNPRISKKDGGKVAQKYARAGLTSRRSTTSKKQGKETEQSVC
ncbi:hypothetical protein ARMSODRAFT_1056515 [Armillaria solidipes]|uniref:Uncharacterized protein n=1 Tax=Armillaria solidipes TaxID=1076256 RepID=A0A2H3AZC8_9AGAR|nr:hypothetical protein ARMSODRAFT_1056515 [Armillaria solidipes]